MVGAHETTGIAAFDADIAGHGSQSAGGAGELLSHAAAGRSPAGYQCCRFGGGIFYSQAFNGVLRHAGYIFRPCGSFGHTILLAQYIAFEYVKSGSVGIQEFLVVQSVFDNNVCHGSEHCGIGTRSDGYPFAGKNCRSFGMARVKRDYFYSLLLDSGQGIGSVRVPDRYGRVPAPH